MTHAQTKTLFASNPVSEARYYQHQFKIFHQQFQIHYQPVVGLNDQRIKSFETLLRWRQGYSLLDPVEFLPLAEETGLIIPLSYWILEEIGLQMQVWRQQFSALTPIMSVNLSASQLMHPNLPERIEDIVQDHNWRPQDLQVEIPQQVLQDDVWSKLNILSTLKALGVQILIDDFDPASDFSTRLRQFPVDAVKLHRVLAHQLEVNEKTSTVVEAGIARVHDLGIEVIAKGIERNRQLDIFKALGCRYGQGFLFSKVVTPQEATDLMARQEAR